MEWGSPPPSSPLMEMLCGASSVPSPFGSWPDASSRGQKRIWSDISSENCSEPMWVDECAVDTIEEPWKRRKLATGEDDPAFNCPSNPALLGMGPNGYPGAKKSVFHGKRSFGELASSAVESHPTKRLKLDSADPCDEDADSSCFSTPRNQYFLRILPELLLRIKIRCKESFGHMVEICDPLHPQYHGQKYWAKPPVPATPINDSKSPTVPHVGQMYILDAIHPC